MTSGMRGLAATSLLIPVFGCSDRPPQTAQYCLDVPSGSTTDARSFAEELAHRLDFDISEAHPEFEPGDVHHEYAVYGRGVTVMILSSMISGEPDEFGNLPTKFDANRYSVSAFKSGLLQRVEFDEVLSAAADAAKSKGLKFGSAPKGQGCAT